ncbi:Hint domain-containing protein [Tateyamaria omphalii]|uniref:Hint domain-containing protein n=1 Tax=Tateyamaria omphalii TaxID=299262 RepID=UPI001C9A1067|nr:Hint domain-containing protein [Tateyamaria omphalii]MBY5931690.1 Hint domain-containing protein [Tateyamaria omphalii]
MARPNIPALRTYEVAALRADGTRSIATFKAPALPLFEAAFSAFARGVVLSSPDGMVAIEDLQPGDWLNTSAGAPAQVMWIGSSSFVPSDTGRRMPLIRVMADSFGLNRPESFITVGPGARLLQTPPHLRGATGGVQVLTPAAEFVDGVNVIEVVPPTPIRLFHICLSRHAAVDVGGIEVETFHPGLQAIRQVTHAQRDLFLSMFPHIAHITDFGPLAHPRAPEPDTVA